MDLLLVHQIYTIILMVLFVSIVGWTWSGKRQVSFREASLLPFADDVTELVLNTSVSKEDHHE